MSAFTGKTRYVACPAWLDHDLKSLCQTASLRQQGFVPRSIEFPMLVTHTKRILRGCFGSEWAAVRFLAKEAVLHSIQNIHGSFWRFWRYRILRKSRAADWLELVGSICPHCLEKVELETVDPETYLCPACHKTCDFMEMDAAQPEEAE